MTRSAPTTTHHAESMKPSRGVRGPSRQFGSVVAALWMSGVVVAQSPTGGQLAPVAKTNIGIEGKVLYRYGGELLARPFSSKSPVVVRIASSAADGAAVLYDLRYIAVKPGRFDLRDALERADGKSLGDGPEAIVEVTGLLPDDHNGELVASPGLGLPWLARYRMALIAVASLWLVPLLVVIIKRLIRRRAVVAIEVTDAPPTLADQLRPLVEAAIAGRAGVDDLAKLERLLIAHWRDRLGLANLSAHAALVKLKTDATGGEILRNVESWLHRPRGSAEPAPDIAAMLEPYRGVGRIELPSQPPVPFTKVAASSVVPTASGGAS